MNDNPNAMPDSLTEWLVALRRHLTVRAEESGIGPVWAELQRRLQEPALAAVRRRLERFERTHCRPRLSWRSDLLLLLLYAKDRLGRPARGICGITRIQKLLFLATHELGCPLNFTRLYRFQPYRLGPFSAEVYDDINLLARSGIVSRQDVDPSGMPVIQTDVTVAADINRLNHCLAEIERLNALSTQISLTSRGRRFAQALADSARRQNPALLAALQALKVAWVDRPLAELLSYVYRRYPEYTTESEILDRLLNRHSG